MSSTTVDLTFCPICLDIFTSPKALPCLHTFCELCLHEYIRATVANARGQVLNVFDCPTCRRIVPAPSKDSWDKWAKQFVLNHMMVTLIDERKRNDPVVQSQIDEKMKSISLESKTVEITPTVDEGHFKPDVKDVQEAQDALIDEELQTPPPHHFPPFYRGHRRGHRHPHGPPPLHPPPPHLFGPPPRHRQPPFGPPPHGPPPHWPPPPHGTHPNFPPPPHGPSPHWQPPRHGHHHIPHSGRGRFHHPPPS